MERIGFVVTPGPHQRQVGWGCTPLGRVWGVGVSWSRWVGEVGLEDVCGVDGSGTRVTGGTTSLADHVLLDPGSPD